MITGRASFSYVIKEICTDAFHMVFAQTNVIQICLLVQPHHHMHEWIFMKRMDDTARKCVRSFV
jgi:hypothetical protein